MLQELKAGWWGLARESCLASMNLSSSAERTGQESGVPPAGLGEGLVRCGGWEVQPRA